MNPTGLSATPPSGIVGFFDVGTKWHIPKSDADFGQTFGQWGWQPMCFIMLPIFGPSNERDTLGLAADTAANPLLYISPYDFVADDPLTYLGPYSYFTYAVMYNNLSDTVNEYVRFSQAEMDPYSEIQYAWTFARENRVANFQVKGKPDEASLETTRIRFLHLQRPGISQPRQNPVGADSRDGQRFEIHFLVAAGIGERGLYCSRPGRSSAGPAFAGAGRVGL